MKGFKVSPVGAIIVTLKSSGEKFSITRADTTVHNFIIGTMYVWNSGEMVCENLNTGEKAVINLATKGWSSKNDYVAEGKIED